MLFAAAALGLFLLAFAVVYGSVVRNRAKAQEMVARDRR